MILKLWYHQNRAEASYGFTYLFAANCIFLDLPYELLFQWCCCLPRSYGKQVIFCSSQCVKHCAVKHKHTFPPLHTSLCPLEITLMRYPKEFMRGVWEFTWLVSTVAGALSTLPHVQKTISKCPLHKYRSAPKCICIKSSLPGMPAYALRRQCAFGCGTSDMVFFCVSDFLHIPRSTKWHTQSYCYLK